MRTICLYTRDPNPVGIKIILENIQKKIKDVAIPIVTDINDAVKYDVVLPYGLLEPIDLLHKDSKKCRLSLMVDATSLINLSQFRYYRNKKILSFKDRYIELLRYWHHIRLEKKVFKVYDDVILVSYGDKRYFEGVKGISKYASKISVIQNGVALPKEPKKPRKDDGKIVLGFLRSWGNEDEPIHNEEKCFLEYIWKEVQRVNSNIQIKFCGKGMSKMQIDYCKQYNNVICIGEVENLADYFDQIDINIMIMPKHGGILNKMLDGFAYKCPTIGEPHNFYAFNNLPDCYYTYSDANSLIDSINRITNNKEEVEKKLELASEYVKANHNWDVNYEVMANKLLMLLNE